MERETFGDTEKERLESRTQLAVLVLEGGVLSFEQNHRMMRVGTEIF